MDTFAATALLALALCGCATTETSEGPSAAPTSGAPATGYVRDLGPEEFRNYVEGHAGVFVLDVRAETEWESEPGPFPDAVRIPLEQIESRKADLPADRERPVAIFDRTGLRSVSAARWIAGQGYRDVATLLGGLEAWKRAGL